MRRENEKKVKDKVNLPKDTKPTKVIATQQARRRIAKRTSVQWRLAGTLKSAPASNGLLCLEFTSFSVIGRSSIILVTLYSKVIQLKI